MGKKSTEEFIILTQLFMSLDPYLPLQKYNI